MGRKRKRELKSSVPKQENNIRDWKTRKAYYTYNYEYR